MSPTLAFESSTDACSIALKIGSQVYAYHEIQALGHTRLLLPQIHRLLNEAEIPLADLKLIVYGQGPGSFTGLRIATSLAQGLAYGLNIPAVGISSLRAMAQGEFRRSQKKTICARLDARMQQFYWACFALDEQGIMQPTTEEFVQNATEIVIPADIETTTTILPNALDILSLGLAEYAHGNSVKPEHIQPVYIRNNVIQT